MKHYDAVIIGSGQGGTPLSKRLAKAGWKTALIEKQYAGGTCINVGCTPTKTMIASARAAYIVASAEKYGVITNGCKINIATILNRKNKVVESFRNSSQKGLETTENLDLIFGTASFTGDKKIKIDLKGGGNQEITADYFFIDTGGRPSIPSIDGLKEAGYYTSSTLMELQEVPEHLLIIGGGYIGLEFGQMYRRFGSKITILENSKRMLPKEDEDIAEEVVKFLEEEGIEIFTHAKVLKVQKLEEHLEVTVKVKEQKKRLLCSHILVSAGRTPNTDELNLNKTGVEINQQNQVIVNDKLETTAKNIYALGDVKGGPEFTHISYNDYIIIANNILEGKEQTKKGRLVPYTMFTDPQLGRIGITEMEAREKGLHIKVAKLPMERVARAIETGDTRGIMKVIVNADNGEILGVAIVGQEGGEIMSVLQMAMVGVITWHQIREMVFAHPLYTESLNNLFMTLEEKK